MSKKDFAIVVGIKRYPHLKSLEGATIDAGEFVKWLIDFAGVPDTNIELVLSEDPPKPGERPILKEIDDAFEVIFEKAKKIQPRRLYFYFAGHGCARTSNHLALIMANAKLDYLNRSLNTLSYHEGLAAYALFPQQIMFYDCCRQYERRVQGRDADWSREDPAAGAGEVTQFILYGAGFTQYANERAFDLSVRRGLFTKALLEGLKGAAAKQHNGQWVVTSRRLENYVASRLVELTKEFGLSQYLGRGPGLVKDLDIVNVQPEKVGQSMQKLTITGPAEGVEIIVSDGDLKEIKRKQIVHGQVVFKLTPGLYDVQSSTGKSMLVKLPADAPKTFDIEEA